MDLNPKETFHVSYIKWITHARQTHHYIGAQIIEQKKEIRDLGVIYDDRLTFNPHVENILSRANALNGAAYRFCKEIHSAPMRMKIYHTYIQPIIEYCSPVWRKSTLLFETKIDKYLRKSTKAALRVPIARGATGYIGNEERLRLLGATTAPERLKMAAIIFIFKIMHGRITYSASNNVIERIQRERNVRPTTHYMIRENGLTNNDPLKSAIELVNLYREYSNITDSPETILRKLISAFHEQREATLT